MEGAWDGPHGETRAGVRFGREGNELGPQSVSATSAVPGALTILSGTQWHGVLFSGWGREGTRSGFPGFHVDFTPLLQASAHLPATPAPGALCTMAGACLQSVGALSAAPSSTLQGQLQTRGSLDHVRRRGNGPHAPREALLTSPPPTAGASLK